MSPSSQHLNYAVTRRRGHADSIQKAQRPTFKRSPNNCRPVSLSHLFSDHPLVPSISPIGPLSLHTSTLPTLIRPTIHLAHSPVHQLLSDPSSSVILPRLENLPNHPAYILPSSVSPSSHLKQPSWSIIPPYFTRHFVQLPSHPVTHLPAYQALR